MGVEKACFVWLLLKINDKKNIAQRPEEEFSDWDKIIWGKVGLPVVPVLDKLKQEDVKFEASLDLMARLCLRTRRQSCLCWLFWK